MPMAIHASLYRDSMIFKAKVMHGSFPHNTAVLATITLMVVNRSNLQA